MTVKIHSIHYLEGFGIF